MPLKLYLKAEAMDIIKHVLKAIAMDINSPTINKAAAGEITSRI
jgi:hypothetical protein